MSLYVKAFVFLLSTSFSSLLLLGFVKHFIWRHPSACSMTYMYQNPEYIPVELDEGTKVKYPNYNLWLYGEGNYARELRANRSYDGIPVLFIPGNSGSYKQVRSLASVSMTKSSDNRSPIRFNYFTVDFSEEFSAFYGASPIRETEFIAVCIPHILKLYSKAPNPPGSVIIVGHSMGGVIGTAAVAHPLTDPRLVQVIYTLGSPHFNPVSVPDHEMIEFYKSVRGFWSDSQKRNHINVVSVGSGVADVVVKSDLVILPDNCTRNIVVMSTAIPRVWTTMDHLCLLWCNQLVLTVVRSMFDLVDERSLQVMTQTERRGKVLEEYFVSGTSRAQRLPAVVVKAVDAPWKTRGDRMTVRGVDVAGAEALAVTVRPGKDLLITTNSMDLAEWIYACHTFQTNDSTCELSEDYSKESVYLPSWGSVTKVRHLSYETLLRDQRRLTILLPHTRRRNISISVDYFEPSLSEWNYSLSTWPQVIDIPASSPFASVSLPNFNSPWLAYKLTITPDQLNCRAYSHLEVPWSVEDTWVTITKQPAVHVLRVIVSQPSTLAFPRVSLYLDTKCKYQLQLQFSLLDTVEQIIRRHWLNLPIFLCACIFQMLAHQFHSLAKTGKCVNIWRTLSVYRIFRNVFVVHLLAAIYEWLPSNELLPTLHWIYRQGNRLEAILVYLFMYLSVAGASVVSHGIITLIVALPAKLAAVLLKRLGWLQEKKQQTWSDWKYTAVAIGGCAVCLYIAQSTSGVIVLCIFFVITLCRAWWSFVRLFGLSPSPEASEARFNMSLALLWMAVFVSNGTLFAFWLRNLSWSWRLQPDPSFIPAAIVTMATLSYRPFNMNNRAQLRSLKWLSRVQNALSVVVLLFQLEHVYLLVWTLSIDTFLLALWSSYSRHSTELRGKTKEMLNDGKQSLQAWKQLIR